MEEKMAQTILEQIIDNYTTFINNPNPSDFLIVTRMHSSNWQKHQDSKYTCADNKGFKYDIFEST
jgi:hypothetical protein